jgi:hypothetical protein
MARYLGGVRSPEVTKTYLAVNMAHWDQHGVASAHDLSDLRCMS